MKLVVILYHIFTVIAALLITGSAAFSDSTPYLGFRPIAPCTIQAENYDNGGEGVAYHDYEPANRSGYYRSDGVDIETTTDNGANYNVSYMMNGEWLKYSINVPVAGNYTVRLRVAGYCNGKYEISVGSRSSGLRQFSATGSFQTWTNSDTTMYLDAGDQYLTIYARSGLDGHFYDDDAVWNTNYVSITNVDSTPPAQVTNFSALAGEAQIAMSWDNPSDTDFYGTTIRYSTTGYPLTPTDGLPVCERAALPGSHDSYIHTGLSTGVTYYYAAFTCDNFGNWSSYRRTSASLPKPFWDVMSDTWVATDALGRELPTYNQCGAPKANKTAGIFYFLWSGQHGTWGPYDITKLLAANPTNPAWGSLWTFHHWSESELGYYLSSDAYVMKKHCRMLANAGIDTLMIDVTNGHTYTQNYMLLCSTLQQIKNEGGKVPQIAFLAYTASDATVSKLYNEFYSQNLYPDLWFRWNGKPLILASPSNLSQTIRDFFTIKQSWAWTHAVNGTPTEWYGNGIDKWAWLDHYPQWNGYSADGAPEEVSVTVAQHATTNIGRSFHGGSQPPIDQNNLCPTTGEGLCFSEQWSRALQLSPPFVFITGWNEWVAQRFTSDGTATLLGRTLPVGETYFVDTYNQEYSRDIEPMKGGHTDNYYYQMITNLRKYKGVRPLGTPSAAKTIVIDGDFSEWDNVAPEYRDHIDDVDPRNTQGWGAAGTYTNNTGRNDFVRSKVARDDDYIYFYAETKIDITSHTDPNWMMLFIDSDCNDATGWNGYDYLVNASVIDSNVTTLKRSIGGWSWSDVTNIAYKVSGNKMELRIPRASIESTGRKLSIQFHWADNIQRPDDIIEFAVSGDSAPDRRFNYRYDTGPIVNRVSSTANGTFKTNGFINIDVEFDTVVYTTGYPTLRLETGSYDQNAIYMNGNGTNKLTFLYIVQPNDVSSHLNYLNINALSAGNGTIKNAYGIAADLILPDINSPESLGANSNIAVDGIAPRVSNVTALSDGAYKAGSVVDIWVEFPEPVNVTNGTPTLELETGTTDRKANYLSGTGTTRLVFRYTVQQGDVSADLNYKATNSLATNGAALRDGAGNVSVNTLPALTALTSLASNRNIVIDTTAPGASSATPTSGVYSAAVSVTLTAEAGCSIRYTTDGTEPTASSSLYELPIELSADTLLRFFAIDAAGNEEPTKHQESYVVLSTNGSIADARSKGIGEEVRLGEKVLYYKSGIVGYIEESDRFAGIRIEDNISANEGSLVNLIGTISLTPTGEKCITITTLTPDGLGSVKALGANNRSAKLAVMDGLLTTVWGIVSPNPGASYFYLSDGSDSEGIKIITPSAPGVTPNTFISVTGAAGRQNTERVIYKK